MMPIFIGYDARQAISFHVLVASILEYSSGPVQIIPLKLSTLPLKRQGLTPFTYSRFLVPALCGFEGAAVFLDADMLLTTDIFEILKDCDPEAAVNVCNTKPAYERAAIMVFNCSHPDNAKLTPEFVETTDEKLHLIKWTQAIHWLPNRWNLLVGYDDPAWCEGKTPSNVHFTQGVPAWAETANCDYAHLWQQMRAKAFIPTCSWATIMGQSNHATEGPGGVTIPAPRVPDAVREPQRS